MSRLLWGSFVVVLVAGCLFLVTYLAVALASLQQYNKAGMIKWCWV